MSRRTFPRVGVAGLTAALLAASTALAQPPAAPPGPNNSLTVDFTYTPVRGVTANWSYTTTPAAVAPMPRPAKPKPAAAACCVDAAACCLEGACGGSPCCDATACPAPPTALTPYQFETRLRAAAAQPALQAAGVRPAPAAPAVTVIRPAPAQVTRLGEFRAVSLNPVAVAPAPVALVTYVAQEVPTGTWYKETPGGVMSVTFGPDGRSLTARAALADDGTPVCTVTLTAECATARDGTMHGVITGADVSPESIDLCQPAQALVGQPFAVRFRPTDGGLMVSSLRCGGSGDEAKKATAAFCGTFKQAADGRVPAPKGKAATTISGMTLPTPHYLVHPPQYFPPDPVFPLQRELVTTELVVPAMGPQPLRLDVVAPRPAPVCPPVAAPCPVPCPTALPTVGFAVNVPGNPACPVAVPPVPAVPATVVRPACPPGVVPETWDVMVTTFGQMMTAPKVSPPPMACPPVAGPYSVPAVAPAVFAAPPLPALPPTACPTPTRPDLRQFAQYDVVGLGTRIDAPACGPKVAAKLTVTDVVSLCKAGLGDDVILTQIKVTDSTFTLSVADLKALKAAGVSDKVIVRMQLGADPTSYSADPNERMKQLLFQSEDLRQIGEVWRRFWFDDQPTHLTPERIHGGIM